LRIGENGLRNIRWEWFLYSKEQNVNHMKTDVVKFDGTNDFDLWRCEVLDALNAQNLENTLLLQERPMEV